MSWEKRNENGEVSRLSSKAYDIHSGNGHVRNGLFLISVGKSMEIDWSTRADYATVVNISIGIHMRYAKTPLRMLIVEQHQIQVLWQIVHNSKVYSRAKKPPPIPHGRRNGLISSLEFLIICLRSWATSKISLGMKKNSKSPYTHKFGEFQNLWISRKPALKKNTAYKGTNVLGQLELMVYTRL